MRHIFSGCVKVFPPLTETAEVVCSYLMNNVLPRNEIPRSIQPESVLELISNVTHFV